MAVVMGMAVLMALKVKMLVYLILHTIINNSSIIKNNKETVRTIGLLHVVANQLIQLVCTSAMFVCCSFRSSLS